MPVILDTAKAPTLSQLLEAIPEASALVIRFEGGERFGEDHPIQGIGPLSSASAREISFIVSPKYQTELEKTEACAVIMTEALYQANEHICRDRGFGVVLCAQPYLLYALVARWFDQARQPTTNVGIHSTAIVDPSAHIDATASIGPFAVIGPRSRIESDVQIQAHTVVGSDCLIGQASILYAGVRCYDRVSIGRRCLVHSGVVLGADGFGFAPNPTAAPGAWGKIAQLGGVSIGDDVEIGANSTIDRGALDDTIIGNGVKIDNQIMIAHNCQIGDHTAMAACVGIAGSTRIGARCTIGGAAMLSGHITIGDDVHISGGTAITTDLPTPGRYTGVLPSAPHSDWQKNAAVIGHLSDLRKRLRKLERH